MADPKVNVGISVDTKEADKALKKLEKEAKDADKAINKLAKDADKAASKELKRLAKEAEDAAIKLKKIGIASGVAFTALAVGISKTISKAADFEAVATQFEVLIGSAEVAKETIKDLAAFSAQTPFQLDEVTDAAKKLLGFGFEAGVVSDKLQFLGDIAAASGTSIGEIALIFGQVSAAGKLTGERLLQFQERAIPIGPAIAKTMGIAETAVRDAVSAGKVDFETFEKAFASIAQKGGQAFDGMAKQSKTLSGQISTLEGNFDLLLAQLGQTFLPLAKDVASGINEILIAAQDNENLVKFAAGASAIALGITGATAAIVAFNIAAPALAPIAAAAGVALGAVSLPMAAVASGFALATVALVKFSDATKKWDEERKSIEPVSLIRPELIEQDKDAVVATFDDLLNEQANFVEISKSQRDKVAEEEKEFRESDTGRKLEQKRLENELLAQIEAEFSGNTKELAATNLALETSIGKERIALINKRIKLTKEIDKKEKLDELVRQKKLGEARSQLEREADQRTVDNAKKLNTFKDQQVKADRARQQAQLQLAGSYANATLSLANNLQALLEQNGRQGNKALFLLQKSAAIAGAIVSTAQGVASALALGPVGIPLAGIIGAAGAAQVGLIASTAIQGFAKGGEITGGIPGQDSVGILAQRGEIIAPKSNFNEVIGSVRAKREAEKVTANGGGGVMEVIVGFADNAFELIESKLIERQRLGISTL